MSKTTVYNVVFRDSNKQLNNRIVRAEHLDDFLYYKGFSIIDHYLMGELYEIEPNHENYLEHIYNSESVAIENMPKEPISEDEKVRLREKYKPQPPPLKKVKTNFI